VELVPERDTDEVSRHNPVIKFFPSHFHFCQFLGNSLSFSVKCVISFWGCIIVYVAGFSHLSSILISQILVLWRFLMSYRKKLVSPILFLPILLSPILLSQILISPTLFSPILLLQILLLPILLSQILFSPTLFLPSTLSQILLCLFYFRLFYFRGWIQSSFVYSHFANSRFWRILICHIAYSTFVEYTLHAKIFLHVKQPFLCCKETIF